MGKTDFLIENNVIMDYSGEDKHFVIPDGVVEIGEEAFICADFESVTIPESVVRISDSAFEYCENLTRIVLPQGLKHIGKNAFDGCEALVEIEIPAGVKEIGEGTFDGCEKLERVVLHEGLERIRDDAFMFCTGLTDINFPSTLEEIGDHAFAECERLENVTLNDKVAISEYTFAGTPYAKKLRAEKRAVSVNASESARRYYSRSSESSLVGKRTLFKGETLKDYIGEEELYIELTSTKSSVRKAVFGGMFIPALIWIIFDGAIITGFFISGMFIENPMSLLILLFFAVHLLPVWMWIGGMVKAAKKGREIFAVTDKKLYSLDGNKLSYVRLEEIEKARADKRKKVAVVLNDGYRFMLDGIAHPDEFANSLNELVVRKRTAANENGQS